MLLKSKNPIKGTALAAIALVFVILHPARGHAADNADGLKNRVNGVSTRLEKAAGFNLRVQIADDARNGAYLLPDGRIQLTSGMVASCQSDDELAFVLAHESAHLQARDFPSSISGHSENEIKADLKGVSFMKKAGYNPVAAIKLLTRLRPDSNPFITRRIESIYESLFKELPK